MMTTVRNPKVIAIAATALCIGSLVWLMSTRGVNSVLETSLEQERLKSESLLSEKLLLEKDVEKMKGQLSSLKGINDDLDEAVRKAEEKFVEREAELARLKKQNATLAEVRKQREALLGVQRELERELMALKASYADLENENRLLASNIAQLQERNRILSEDLNRAMFASVDQSQVQAVKGRKERLTVRARRTNKLIADFEVPANMRSISFRIVDPKGNALGEKQGTIVYHASAGEQNVVASNAEGAAGPGIQKVKMEYTPKQRLQAGVYKVEILNENLYVGSLNVKLR